MNVWQNQESTPILKIAAKAAYKVLWDYFKKSIAIRHRFVSLIYDPRYKIEVLEFLFDAEGGVSSSSYKKGKLYFQHVYSDYSRRAALVKNWNRIEAENKAANTQEAYDRDYDGDSLEVEGEEDWRTNPLHGFGEFMAAKRRPTIVIPVSTGNEVDRWLTEPNLPLDSIPDDIRKYIRDRRIEFLIII